MDGELLVVFTHPERGQVWGRLIDDAAPGIDFLGGTTYPVELLDGDRIQMPESWLVMAVTL